MKFTDFLPELFPQKIKFAGIMFAMFRVCTGLPMKLTYFQHPHEVLTTPPSLDHVTSRDQEMGVSANVLVEKSTQPFLISLDPNLLR